MLSLPLKPRLWATLLACGLSLSLPVQTLSAKTVTRPAVEPVADTRAGESPATHSATHSAKVSADAFATQKLALDLARYGDRNKDALALIQAARLQSSIGTRVRVDSPVSNAAMLQRARDYAKGRPDLLALIDDEAGGKSRGALQGPILEHFLAPVNELQRFIVRFTGGSQARISLNTDDPQQLEVEVLDPSGQNVCMRLRGSKECTWTPSATAEYRIQIRNVGASTREFSFFHN